MRYVCQGVSKIRDPNACQWPNLRQRTISLAFLLKSDSRSSNPEERWEFVVHHQHFSRQTSNTKELRIPPGVASVIIQGIEDGDDRSSHFTRDLPHSDIAASCW